ncbi:MAG: 50S ribosomal protein L17 [Oligoflexia bacterium]|nr:50S ribosomal protein L17 [Oligoflexia bacterium]
MRHASRTQSFSRPYNQRVWLLRNLVISLVEHERISTTLAKAKELRRWAEKAVTLGKRGSLADRRLLLSRIPNKETVAKVFAELAPRFKDRAGGYTRIYRLGRRPGDNAEMALIEFLDAQLKKVDKETTKKAKKAEKDLAAGGKEAKAKARDDKKVAREAKASTTAAAKATKAAKKETKAPAKKKSK